LNLVLHLLDPYFSSPPPSGLDRSRPGDEPALCSARGFDE
jgi:hypothetical protein